MNITNQYGIEFDFCIIVSLMDNDLREKLHREIAPCTEQKFFNTYCKDHFKKYSEEFECNKSNPQI